MSEQAHYSGSGQRRHLVGLFFAWKCLLLIVAACSPGPGYDTSSLILLTPSQHRHNELTSKPWPDRLALSLFRWDALYFVNTAQRGYVFEQEWAFSGVYSAILKFVVKSFSRNPNPPLLHLIWAGIAVSNVSHLVSVLVLFRLLNVLLGTPTGSRTSFIACVLSILSPAGLFLSAPYGEALFAALNMSGMLCYVQARVTAHSSKSWTALQDVQILCSATLFGLATWIRGNGLLSGLILLFDVVSVTPSITSLPSKPHEMRRIAITLVAGGLLGIMSVVPQLVAYQEYCINAQSAEARPWCHRRIPSIYTWVQSEYWNVGFLRYWTLPNLPLFVVAAPMLWLLFQSSVTYFRAHIQKSSGAKVDDGAGGKGKGSPPDSDTCHLPQLVLPQLALTVAATTSFHVQIINRISSGYPMWYLSVAEWLTARGGAVNANTSGATTQLVVRGMVMYSVVQGVLYAGFLPPA